MLTLDSKTPSDCTCLWEPPGGFCDVGCHFIFVFNLLLFFIWFPGYFTMSPALHPSFSDLWRPRPAVSSTSTTFDRLFFFIYLERYGFEWAFSSHRHFLPYASSRHFWHNLLLSRPPWELTVLSWSLQDFILILKTETQPICLFDLQ